MVRAVLRVPLLSLLLLLPLAAGCDDLAEFRGEYKGGIIGGAFVRSCFPDDTIATLQFAPEDAVISRDGLPTAQRNRLSTTDKTFTDTPLEPVAALQHDPLSEFDFPGPKRLRNYLLLARPESGPLAGRDALVVVSLMDSKRVEVRVIARTADGSAACPARGGAGDGPRQYFGVFRLTSS